MVAPGAGIAPGESDRRDGSVGAEVVRLIDFDDIENHDWLAVNQFTASVFRGCVAVSFGTFRTLVLLGVQEVENSNLPAPTIFYFPSCFDFAQRPSRLALASASSFVSLAMWSLARVPLGRIATVPLARAQP